MRRAAGLGDVTYRRMRELARAQAAGLDERGIGRGERVAVLSQNSGRLLTSFFGVSGYGRVLVPINFRLSPAEIEYILEHSGASMLLVDPELADAVAHLPVKHRVVMGTDTDGEVFLEGREPEPWDEQDEDATATINYTSRHHGPPQGRGDDAPQPVEQRGDLRVAHRRVRPRHLPAHPADVPLQRLGHALRARPRWACRRSCCARSTAPTSCAASTSTASRCCAARRRSSRWCSTPPRPGTARSPATAAPASWWRARRRPPARSSGSRPSSAGR